MSSFGRSSASSCSGEGDVKKPVVTATTRSAIPRRFQARSQPAEPRHPRRSDANHRGKQPDDYITDSSWPRKRARQPSSRIEYEEDQTLHSIDLDTHDPTLRDRVDDAPEQGPAPEQYDTGGNRDQQTKREGGNAGRRSLVKARPGQRPARRRTMPRAGQNRSKTRACGPGVAIRRA